VAKVAAVIGDDVRQVIADARREAASAGHGETGLGHVLVALAGAADSPAGRVLQESRVTVAAARAALGRIYAPATRAVADPPLSASVHAVLARASGRAEELGRQAAGWEDLLLALTDEDTDAVRIIEAVGARAAEIRDRALFTLDIPTPFTQRVAERELVRPVPPERPAVAPPGPEQTSADRDRARRVFVIHGRDLQARDAVWSFIRSLDLLPVEFREVERLSASAAPLIPDTVTSIFPYAQAVVALLTPDDVVSLHPELAADSDPDYEKRPVCQSRPNVFFEIGMAFGVKPNETIIVQLGNVRPFSDIVGRSVLRLDRGEAEVLVEFKERLRKAGCPVRDQGTDWIRPDRFTRLTALSRTP
jgi:predicted nucleotide-binding protein